MFTGRLRKRITVQSLPDTSDGSGGASAAWTDLVEAWASVIPLTGRELLQSQAVQASTTHTVTLRYRPGITAKCRILLGSRVFRITAPPRDVEERHRELAIDCAEVFGETP